MSDDSKRRNSQIKQNEANPSTAASSEPSDEVKTPARKSSTTTAAATSAALSPNTANSTAAASSEAEAAESDSDSDSETKSEDVFQRPLIYYKRQTGVNQRRGAQSAANNNNNDDTTNDIPIQIQLPDNTVCLGFPPDNSLTDSAIHSQPNSGLNPNQVDNLLVYSGPSIEHMQRARIFGWLLMFLLLVDVVLVSLIYFLGRSIGDSASYNSGPGSFDTLTYTTTMLELGLAVMALILRNTRLATMFMVVYYIDALINLIRVYSVLQFAHFILQLAINHVMGQFKTALLPNWAAPLQ